MYCRHSYTPKILVFFFFLAFSGLSVSWLILGLNREPSEKNYEMRISFKAYFNKLLNIFKKDHNFRNYLLARGIFHLGNMGLGFITIYAVKIWSLSDNYAGKFTIAFFSSQSLAYLITGYLADKYGHKINMVVGNIILIVGMTTVLWNNSPNYYLIVFLLVGISSAVETLSHQVIVFEFSNDENRPAYIGCANTMTGTIGFIAPIIGSWIVLYFGFRCMFGLASLVLVFSLILIIVILRDPRHKGGQLIHSE